MVPSWFEVLLLTNNLDIMLSSAQHNKDEYLSGHKSMCFDMSGAFFAKQSLSKKSNGVVLDALRPTASIYTRCGQSAGYVCFIVVINFNFEKHLP